MLNNYPLSLKYLNEKTGRIKGAENETRSIQRKVFFTFLLDRYKAGHELTSREAVKEATGLDREYLIKLEGAIMGDKEKVSVISSEYDLTRKTRWFYKLGNRVIRRCFGVEKVEESCTT